MKQKNLEVGREYDCAVGRVRVLSVNAPGLWPIVFETLPDGKLYRTSVQDGFVAVPLEFEFQGWVNVYYLSLLGKFETRGGVYLSKKEALNEAYSNVIACVPVVVKGVEGQGLQPEAQT